MWWKNKDKDKELIDAENDKAKRMMEKIAEEQERKANDQGTEKQHWIKETNK